jgi:hypothetical protein
VTEASDSKERQGGEEAIEVPGAKRHLVQSQKRLKTGAGAVAMSRVPRDGGVGLGGAEGGAVGGAVVRSFPIPVPHPGPPSTPPQTTTPSAPAASRIQTHVLSPRGGGGGGAGAGAGGGGGGGGRGGGDGEDAEVLLQGWLGLGQSKVVRGGKKTVHYSAFRRGTNSHKFSI